MEHIKLAIVLQKAIKYNKIARRHGNLENAETALEKALNNAANIGFIATIWKENLINQIVIGDHLLEVR